MYKITPVYDKPFNAKSVEDVTYYGAGSGYHIVNEDDVHMTYKYDEIKNIEKIK